jgi:hypothetical protein
MGHLQRLPRTPDLEEARHVDRTGKNGQEAETLIETQLMAEGGV